MEYSFQMEEVFIGELGLGIILFDRMRMARTGTLCKDISTRLPYLVSFSGWNICSADMKALKSIIRKNGHVGITTITIEETGRRHTLKIVKDDGQAHFHIGKEDAFDETTSWTRMARSQVRHLLFHLR